MKLRRKELFLGIPFLISLLLSVRYIFEDVGGVTRSTYLLSTGLLFLCVITATLLMYGGIVVVLGKINSSKIRQYGKVFAIIGFYLICLLLVLLQYLFQVVV